FDLSCHSSVQHLVFRSTVIKLLLAPFSILYGFGVSLRNWAYRTGWLKSISFNLPVISVGNLSVGGAGKTPHVEYLVRKLLPYLNIATLSRGYRRKSRGFLIVNQRHNAEQVGDEPLQYFRKFPELTVTVAEERALAIPQIVSARPDLQLVILDDAFQHRAVRPGLNILLTQFAKPFTQDFLLPSGRLREWRTAYHRADTIIVTKCPPDLNQEQADALRREIDPQAGQSLFFSYYDYGQAYYVLDSRYRLKLDDEVDILLLCAIANTEYLISYLNSQARSVYSLEYEDHHYFTHQDMGNLASRFKQLDSRKKAIITTEKDASRLELHRKFIRDQRLPIFVLPVQVKFHFEEEEKFDGELRDFLLNFTA
ncbi:MAG: tetraacyldisaccharide 4'-kinase, partial [Bacteroidota bacterium]